MRASLVAGTFARHAVFALGIGFAHDFGPERARANLRKFVRRRALRPFFTLDADDLRNNVAGALNAHHVADADVLALDFIGIVQGDIGHDHAADIDRFQPRHRRQCAHAADLDIDGQKSRQGLLRREFMGYGPARAARHKAQAPLIVEPVDLIDDAIDIVAELRAHLADMFVGIEQALRPFDADRVGIDLEAPFTEFL